jgi:hypothetical protein
VRDSNRIFPKCVCSLTATSKLLSDCKPIGYVEELICGYIGVEMPLVIAAIED